MFSHSALHEVHSAIDSLAAIPDVQSLPSCFESQDTSCQHGVNLLTESWVSDCFIFLSHGEDCQLSVQTKSKLLCVCAEAEKLYLFFP